MRFYKVVFLSVGFLGLSVSTISSGCGGDSDTATTGQPAGTAVSASISTGASMKCIEEGGGGAGATDCPLDPATCETALSNCLAFTDNSCKKQLGLRMSELDITAPPGLVSGGFGPIVNGTVKIDSWPPSPCTSTATSAKIISAPTVGAFNWLLALDLDAKTLKTGGAKPVTDPTQGYSFVDEMIMGAAVAPLMTTVNITDNPDGSITFDAPMGADVTVPIFTDQTATMAVLLPLHQTRMTQTKISKDHNCIGALNTSGLTGDGNCAFSVAPTQTSNVAHAFTTTDGGHLEGYMLVDETDTVSIPQLKETLCVLLTGQMGIMMGGMKVCDHTDTATYKGDWCAATNLAGDAGCHDAFHLTADFAASAVKIN